MPDLPDQLLSEFIDDWNAGRRPDVRAFLQRTTSEPDRDELADQLGAWLAVAPTPEYDGPTRDAIRAEPVVARVVGAVGQDAGLWPQLLPSLRERAGLSLSQLASGVSERFHLGDTTRTEEHLGRLERGELAPTRVSRRLLDGLGELLGVSATSLRDAGGLGRGLRPAGALFRTDTPGAGEQLAADFELLGGAAFEPAPAAAPLDDLDRLFLGGPDG